jgi:hypothetical protein
VDEDDERPGALGDVVHLDAAGSAMPSSPSSALSE